MAEQTPTKPTKAAKDQFTIVDNKTGAVFISQPYSKREEADAKLAQLKGKFSKQYDLVVARVDDQGGLHQVTDK